MVLPSVASCGPHAVRVSTPQQKQETCERAITKGEGEREKNRVGHVCHLSLNNPSHTSKQQTNTKPLKLTTLPSQTTLWICQTTPWISLVAVNSINPVTGSLCSQWGVCLRVTLKPHLEPTFAQWFPSVGPWLLSVAGMWQQHWGWPQGQQLVLLYRVLVTLDLPYQHLHGCMSGSKSN